MTLLVALKGHDGLALAADSRGTFGDPRGVTAQNDSQQKAHVLAPHVAVLQAGAGEVGAVLISEVSAQLSAAQADGVDPVLDALRSLSRSRFNEWFPTVPAIQAPQPAMTGEAPTRPTLAFIVAGYNLDESPPTEAKIFQLQSGLDFSPFLHDYGFAVAGIAQYALYLLNRLYEPGRTIADLAALAVYVITETASQDGKVGGPVNVITITPQEGCMVLERSAVDAIVQQNEARSTALRKSFYSSKGDGE